MINLLPGPLPVAPSSELAMTVNVSVGCSPSLLLFLQTTLPSRIRRCFNVDRPRAGGTGLVGAFVRRSARGVAATQAERPSGQDARFREGGKGCGNVQSQPGHQPGLAQAGTGEGVSVTNTRRDPTMESTQT